MAQNQEQAELNRNNLLRIELASTLQSQNDQTTPPLEVCLVNQKGHEQFKNKLSASQPVYIQMQLLQEAGNPREIRIENETHVGYLRDGVDFDQALLVEKSLTLKARDEMDEHGNAVPSKLAPLIVNLQLKAIPNYQILEPKQGLVLVFKSLGLNQDVKSFVKQNQSVVPSSKKTREILLKVSVGNQTSEVNIEEAHLASSAHLYCTEHDQIKFEIEERVYKLERDEAAMLKRVQNTNIKAMGVDQFLYSRQGGLGELEEKAKEIQATQANGAQNQPSDQAGSTGMMSLDSIIDKKRVFLEKKSLFKGQVTPIATLFAAQIEQPGIGRNFEARLSTAVSVLGTVSVCANQFTQMPKGRLQFQIEQLNQFQRLNEKSTPDEWHIEPLMQPVLRISKQVAADGEQAFYRLNEQEMTNKQIIDFDTCFFDDKIKIEIFQNNSTAKVNLVAKTSMRLCEMVFENPEDEDEELIPITLKDKKTGFQAGTLFINMKYEALDSNLLNQTWPNALRGPKKMLDSKYEFFNEQLANEFKDDCQFGFLSLELTNVAIPKLTLNNKSAIGGKSQNDQNEAESQLNEIFMLKIKVGSESNQIFVGAPNQILRPDPANLSSQKMTGNVDSYFDKVYVEFYDVVNESAFDPRNTKSRTDLSNLKLLSHKIFDIRDLPFNSHGLAEGFRLLMPVAQSGNMAAFTISAMFQRNVPQEYVERPLLIGQRYILILRMLRTVKEALHYHKDLDANNIVAEVRNSSHVDGKAVSKRLFFNKEILVIGDLVFGVNDTIKITFSLKRTDADGNPNLVPFVTNEYLVSPQGLQLVGEQSATTDQTSLVKQLQQEMSTQGSHASLPNQNGSNQAVQLETWKAVQISVPFNFTKETQFLEFGRKNTVKKGGNTLGSMLGASSGGVSGDMIQENVRMELEVRDSDFVELLSRNQIQSSFVNVFLDKASVIDCLAARDLTQDAEVRFELISEDRRSLRYIKTFSLSEFDFDESVKMRLFKEGDAVQITIEDSEDKSTVVMQLACLPLSMTERVSWFSQIKSKQLKFELQLEQDTSLLTEEEAKVAIGTEQKQVAGDKTQELKEVSKEVETVADLQKQSLIADQKAMQEMLNSLQNLPNAAMKVLKLKQWITEQKLKNKKLITKQLRVKKETEVAIRSLEDAKKVKPVAKKATKTKETDWESEFKTMVEGAFGGKTSQKPKLAMSGAMAKKKNDFQICACGQLNPEHRGYCTECVRKLKSKLDRLLDEYGSLQDEMDEYNRDDLDKASEKLKLMRAKAEQYEVKLSDVQMLDVMERHSKLADSEENRSVAERKILLNSLRQELKILSFKIDSEKEDFEKQMQWLKDRCTSLQKAKKDQERETGTFMYEFDKAQTEIDNIEKRTYLKRRYVAQQLQIQKAQERKKKQDEEIKKQRAITKKIMAEKEMAEAGYK